MAIKDASASIRLDEECMSFVRMDATKAVSYTHLDVYKRQAINGAHTFWDGFWQCFVILSVMNLINRLGIDGYWVGHTRACLLYTSQNRKE